MPVYFGFFSEIKYWINLFISFVSVFLNGILFYLIKTKSSKSLENYKKVLYLGCVMDFMCSFWNFLLEPDVTVIKGIYFVFNRGALGFLPFPETAWTHPISMFFIYFGLVNVLIQFIYRYLLICWNLTLNKRIFLGLTGIGIALVVGNCVMHYIHLITRNVRDAEHSPILRGTEYEINGKILPFGAFPLAAFSYTLSLSVILVIASYLTVIYCGIKIYLKIKNEEAELTPDSKKYQRQISIVMTVEACILIITLVFPILLDLITITNGIYLSWGGKLSFLICSFVPFLNPIIKILVISCYRNWVIKKFSLSKLLFKHRIDSSSAINVK